MALTPQDKNQLYSEAFATNAKAMMGESAFTALDMKTRLDVAQMELGVAQDEITAKDKALAESEQRIASLEVELTKAANQRSGAARNTRALKS